MCRRGCWRGVSQHGPVMPVSIPLKIHEAPYKRSSKLLADVVTGVYSAEIEDSALGEVPLDLMDPARSRAGALLSIFLAVDFPTPKSSATKKQKQAF